MYTALAHNTNDFDDALPVRFKIDYAVAVSDDLEALKRECAEDAAAAGDPFGDEELEVALEWEERGVDLVARWEWMEYTISQVSVV
jgi:hypothetical protein